MMYTRGAVAAETSMMKKDESDMAETFFMS